MKNLGLILLGASVTYLLLKKTKEKVLVDNTPQDRLPSGDYINGLPKNNSITYSKRGGFA